MEILNFLGTMILLGVGLAATVVCVTAGVAVVFFPVYWVVVEVMELCREAVGEEKDKR
jgi:hypothetical protein